MLLPLCPDGPLLPVFPKKDKLESELIDEDEGSSFNDAKILFADYNGWWSPLSHLFFSSTSKCLVSTHPESSIEEVDSFYCSQCLEYFAEAEAQTWMNRCPQCFECPKCFASNLSIISRQNQSATTDDEELEYIFCCSFCSWSSNEVNLVDKDPTFLSMIVNQLEREEADTDIFQTINTFIKQRTYQSMQAKKFKVLHGGTNMLGNKNTEKEKLSERGVWKIEALNKKEIQTLEDFHNENENYLQNAPLHKGKKMDEISEEKENISLANEYIKVKSIDELSSLRQMCQYISKMPTFSKDLLPIRKALLSKRSRRCLKDLNAGRPGILLKPKLNPMEGDSSLRSNVGQWFNKDTSAVNFFPSFKVFSVPKKNQVDSFLSQESNDTTTSDITIFLKISNVSIEELQVRIHPARAPHYDYENDTFVKVIDEVVEDVDEHDKYYYEKNIAPLFAVDNQKLIWTELRLKNDNDNVNEEGIKFKLEGFEDDYLNDNEDADVIEKLIISDPENAFKNNVHVTNDTAFLKLSIRKSDTCYIEEINQEGEDKIVAFMFKMSLKSEDIFESKDEEYTFPVLIALK